MAGVASRSQTKIALMASRFASQSTDRSRVALEGEHGLLIFGRHLARVDFEPVGEPRRRSRALGLRQGHLGLKARAEDASFPAHLPAPKGVPISNSRLISAP